MATLTKILVGLLIAAALLLIVYALSLQRRSAPPVSNPPTLVPVVVAAKTLAIGKPITADALRIDSLPTRPSGAFADPGPLIKRTPLVAINANTPVFEAQLSSGLAGQIAADERAVAVRVDESTAVGNHLQPGNLVDVFFTLKREPAGLGQASEIDRTQARLLLTRLRVLAFGQDVLGDNTLGAGSNANANANANARTAVLAVPITQIDRLLLAESAGRLILTLRNPKDDEMLDGAARANNLTLSAAAKGVALADLANLTHLTDSRGMPLPDGWPNRHASNDKELSGNRGNSNNAIQIIRGGHIERVD